MSRPARRMPATATAPVYRVALVTGANRGLGFEVARQLSERGMAVLLGARDLDKGLHAARQLTGAPGEVIAVQLDVTQQDQVDTLARWIEITYGRLAGAAAVGVLIPMSQAAQTDIFSGWHRIWLIAGAGLVLLAAVQAFRKWIFENQ